MKVLIIVNIDGEDVWHYVCEEEVEPVYIRPHPYNDDEYQDKGAGEKEPTEH